MSHFLQQSGVRRLLFAVALLALADQFVPLMLERTERSRYESDRLFRFENSDLFSLGPLVSYLAEHPRGDKPRVAFMGDSVIWGYFIKPSEAVPAQFQRLRPDLRVFNLAVNGFETGSAYLMTKATIEAIDTYYILLMGSSADRKMASLIPVALEDVARFGIEPPDLVERHLERGIAFWHLYANSYRLQSAFFGTSTRQYLYLHKGELLRRLRGGAPEADLQPAVIDDPDDSVRRVKLEFDKAPVMPGDGRRRELETAYDNLWRFSQLAVDHRKQIVFLSMIDHSPVLARRDRADLNALLAPNVAFVNFEVPVSLLLDNVHLNPIGAKAVAEKLAQAVPPLVRGTDR